MVNIGVKIQIFFKFKNFKKPKHFLDMQFAL